MNSKYYIFSDESGIVHPSRYATIALISGEDNYTKCLNKKLKCVLYNQQKDEIKLSKVSSEKHISIAKDFVKMGLAYIAKSKIKVDVICWDKEDSRHKGVRNRCDIQNLIRMYYHGLHSLIRGWGANITNWHFYPDEQSAIDWENDVLSYLRNKMFDFNDYHDLDIFDIDLDKFKLINMRFKSNELSSKQYPIIQLADLFAGIVRMSRENGYEFDQWRPKNQMSMFEPVSTSNELSSISKNRIPKFKVLDCFKNEASRNKLGVNFSENKYFKTFNRKTNLFIWHYHPQGEYDKAPTKISK